MKVCSVDGCLGGVEAKGLCVKHYARLRKHGDTSVVLLEKHGMSSKPIYAVWCSMMARCYRESCKEYRWYGAKGIVVCDEWHTKKVFFDWAYSSGYELGLTIDRIDVSEGYSPSNCRWVTRAENSRMMALKYYMAFGKSDTLDGWCAQVGISRNTLKKRLHTQGLSLEEALSKPLRHTGPKLKKEAG